MSADNDLLFQRVQESFRKLSFVSTNLNAASDKLGASAGGLDAALKRLNLGISSWVAFSKWQSEDHFHYRSDDVGYTKAGGKWGLAIEGNGNTNEDLWPFNEAPRSLRTRAVAKIPDLLDKLIANATDAAAENRRGDHRVFRNAAGQITVVSGHLGDDVRPGTYKAILRQTRIKEE
jgi:hypothetical protein